ncbi:MAG: glutamate synthase large subunit [Candidatus Omnitrophota bacterium]
MKNGLPKKQGLYDPRFEHDNCGVGFVCDIKGKRSHGIIEKGIEVLEKMSHRGAVGADPKTGDGAGLLLQLPHKFYERECRKNGIDLPDETKYGTGLIFLPVSREDRNFCESHFRRIVEEEDQRFLGWRDVPVDETIIGECAKETQPKIRQIFIGWGDKISEQPAFERKLYVIRRRIEKEIRSSDIGQKSFFYITNLSSRTISYKGLLMPKQVKGFYPDLMDKDVKSSIALVHSRYSTNTFPTWDLAQPFRFLAHNGEINTLRGNINWFHAKERLLTSELFKNDIEKLKPIIVEGGSDSAAIDNVFELLVLAGRPIEQVMMMLIPSAWEHDENMDPALKDFYRYHACFMEPWDGPAALAFTDGKNIGAVLDRNGLRPARYIVTKSGLAVMASEVGVIDIEPKDILVSGRLEPGKMFFIDTEKGCIVDDKDIKENVSNRQPYGEWVRANMVEFNELKGVEKKYKEPENMLPYFKCFGYTREDLKEIIKPMAESGKEPIGSMGNDTPIAVLSNKRQLLYNYFKQLFAQVTNPAIDPIREELVMSLDSFMGEGRNILKEGPKHCHKLRVREPLLTNKELEAIRDININGFKTKTIHTFFNSSDSAEFTQALDRICFEAEFAIEEGYTFIILSDRGVNKEKTALPTLLALSAVHQHLVRKTVRSQITIIIESGEPREVHHFALLFGYGADCVNPYMAYDVIKYLKKEGQLTVDNDKAVQNYIKAVHDGILKILSKMGISTLRSYRGAQIFEALGLNDDVIEKHFTGTSSRIGGIGIDGIVKETIRRHDEAFLDTEMNISGLSSGGIYQWKRDGEFHLWRPESIAALQDAVRKEDYGIYKTFAGLINDQSKNPTTLRSLLKFRKAIPISIGEVEPVKEIVKRFATGAMSFGSISKSTHEVIAIAMNRIGAKSNTGEGGEDSARFAAFDRNNSARSAIKQIASGRFGVNANYLVNADEIQIKIAQGAKPGEGGQLPGHKVSEMIARTRYTTPGVTLISPPPHHDIYSIEDLAQLIFDLKNVNPRARVSVKLVSEVGVGTVAAGVAKGHADMILISGGDGGTGASPKTSIRYAGLPWELGLAETQQTLVLNGLRERVRLQTDGQMRTGRDVALAALLGAEEFGFCTSVLITLGCVMLRHCHLNNCSVGVATQDYMLGKQFKGRPEYVVNYMMFIAQELREIMAGLGVRKVDNLVGRTDLLEMNTGIIPGGSGDIDYSKILFRPEASGKGKNLCTFPEYHETDHVMDHQLIKMSKSALSNGKIVEEELSINNTDRAVGAMLSGEVCRIHGERGLPEDSIHFKFRGIAGQSFGAFLMKGVTFELSGLANDYVGKGISGGKIIIYPDKNAGYVPEKNVIIGNTAFYGAISGEAYINGAAGERFCVRNSGIYAVVEEVGDHGCEYMTGGRVVVLGKTGRNFAAGMSGGIAYVRDEDGMFKDKCNMSMVELEGLNEEDKITVNNLVHNHFKYTSSNTAEKILKDFDNEVLKFIKIIPVEYKRIKEGSMRISEG